MASAAAPSEVAGLLDHCSELKRQLVEFACSRRFSGQLDRALREGPGGEVADESEFISIVDHLSCGLFLAGVQGGEFVSERPELAEADRQMLLGWRGVVEGVLEIRERDDRAIIAANLIDELTYRIYSDAGSGVLASMGGCLP